MNYEQNNYDNKEIYNNNDESAQNQPAENSLESKVKPDALEIFNQAKNMSDKIVKRPFDYKLLKKPITI